VQRALRIPAALCQNGMITAALLAAAVPVGLILVFSGFTAARAFAVFGPPVITLPAWGGGAACDAACAAPASKAATKAA
jgi:hypothetical protein